MKLHRARRACGLILVALAVALTACGSSDKDNYKKDAKAIIDPLKTTFNDLDAKVNSSASQDQKLAQIESARKEIDTAANKLDKLDPPSDIKTAHDNFVNELHTFADDFGAIESAVKSKDQNAGKTAAAKLQADAAKLKQANDALEAKVNE
jgi:hypothetical protein